MKWKHEFYCETAVIKSTDVLHDQSHADAALECILLYTIFSQLLNLSSKLMNVSKCYRKAHGKQRKRGIKKELVGRLGFLSFSKMC